MNKEKTGLEYLGKLFEKFFQSKDWQSQGLHL